MSTRVLLAVVVVLVDLAVFVVPLAGLLIGYVLIANPPWVGAFLARLRTGSEPDDAA